MEACGIEGSYRTICQLVMEVVRDKKESLLAIFQSFLDDPLTDWKIFNIGNEEK